MTDLLDELADALGANEDERRVDEGRATARTRLHDARLQPAVRRRPRRARRAWLVPAVAALVVLGGGAALAATTDFAQRILGSNAPAVDRIGVLQKDGPTMTMEELRMLFDREEVRRHIGERIMGDRGQRVVEDERIRIGAVATSTGGVCMVVSEWDDGSSWPTSGWHGGSAGCGAFTDGWPLMDASGARGSGGFSFSYGLVADGVASVRFEADGRTYDAVMGRSGYLWRHPEGVRPTAIEVILEDGTIVRREYPPKGVYQPPSEPRVVGNVNDE